MERARVKKIVPPIFVLMVIIFTILCIFFYRESIETQLTDKVKQSFNQSNIALSETLDVEFSGRDAYVTGWVENSDDKERIYDLVDNVEGVKLVYTDLQMKEIEKPVAVKQPEPEPVVEKIVESGAAVIAEPVQVVQEPVVVQEIVQEPVVEVIQEAPVQVNYQDIEQKINSQIVYFDYDKIFIKPEFEDELAEVNSILNEYPDVSVRITGFTDRRGTEEYNMELSKRRALEVQRYLVDAGVNSQQLEIDYKGEVIRDDLHYWKFYKYDRKVEFKFLNQVSH